MTQGVGGSTAEEELAQLVDCTGGAEAITLAQRRSRIAKAVQLMCAQGIHALVLPPGSSLFYFTGLRWGSSERLTAAVLTQRGEIEYIAPAFEAGTLAEAEHVDGSDTRVGRARRSVRASRQRSWAASVSPVRSRWTRWRRSSSRKGCARRFRTIA